MTEADDAAALRASGLRVTAQRRAVLEALDEGSHASAAVVARRVSASARMSRPLSRQGLYNVLDDLNRAGLVRCIEPSGSPALYERRAGDNHHHLVCRTCGQVEDVECAVGAAPCLVPAASVRFRIDEAEVTWWGLCSQCSSATGVPAQIDKFQSASMSIEENR